MNIVNNFRNWRKYKETYGELARLTSRELADMGFQRTDIDGVARRAAGY